MYVLLLLLIREGRQEASQQVSEWFVRFMKMGNPNAPGRPEILEQELAKIKEFVMGSGRDELVATVGEIAKK